MSVESGVRATRRAQMEARILDVARQHLAAHGAAALSLRAVARDLGVASSAVYRYVDSRDELLTRLIVSAYDSLGDLVDERLATAEVDPETQFATVASSLRDWALQHPSQYTLLYGSPVPGYAAPPERTIPAGTRVTRRLLHILADLQESNTDPVTQLETATGAGLSGLLQDPAVANLALSAPSLARGLAAWSMITGALMAEMFGHYGPDAVSDPGAHFEETVRLALVVAAR